MTPGAVPSKHPTHPLRPIFLVFPLSTSSFLPFPLRTPPFPSAPHHTTLNIVGSIPQSPIPRRRRPPRQQRDRSRYSGQATSTVASAGTMAPVMWLLASALSVASVAADMATISAMGDVPDWQTISAMTLTVSAPGAPTIPLKYTVVPLTTSLGLNQSELARGVRVQSACVLVPVGTC